MIGAAARARGERNPGQQDRERTVYRSRTTL
jgi:hypothetical protein